ncbi:L-threonylcarbamoyladenylate synthase [Marinigracilibium pacificum]|uniref:Threonylcarbamoyl-AMP synthase n=1 Tax=Marinigracilibium pacificum TaxID=2729599 RepID=A0A848IZN6_9BACT|nr:L-threonylcarbamoyladenylate synthase [Marinigracilibium pacificum]NMM48745.1 threonylcarbamoyl-AMP synthase [Marinigracilibium pacificum]
MEAKLIQIHPDNPNPKKIKEVAQVLSEGGVVIYPTDTVYGMGCDLTNSKAIERVCRIKQVSSKKLDLSFICYDLSHISEYAKNIDNSTFKLMKRALPGPYTFILNASSKVPKILNVKKKTVGIRVPDNNIPREIVNELGNPIITTSIKDEDEIIEYSTDPSLIYEKFKNLVDIVIDGGFGGNIGSTVIDCSGNQAELLREGLGKIDELLI